MEAGKPGSSPGSLSGDHSQSQHNGCRSGGRDVLDMVTVRFAKGGKLARAPEWHALNQGGLGQRDWEAVWWFHIGS